VATTYPTNGAYSVFGTMATSGHPLSGPVAQISPWTPVEVGFSEAMDPATINATSFQLIGPNNQAVAATYVYDSENNVAILTPTAMLSYGKTYTVTVTTAILAALDAAPLEAGVTWNFTVTATGQSVGLNAGAPDTNYVVTADGTVYLPDQYVTGGTVRTVGSPVTAPSDPDLYLDERVGDFSYTLKVPDGTYDVKLFFAETEYNGAGQRVFNVDIPETAASPDLNRLDIYSEAGKNNALIKTITNVTTVPAGGQWGTMHINTTGVTGQAVLSALLLIPKVPVITASTPANGSTNQARSTAPTATFSQSMDPATISSTTVTLTAANGTLISANVSYSSKKVTLNPTGPLTANTAYTVRLDGSIKSLAGVKIAGPVSWTFTTGSK
jgi:hypothetical protein